MTIGEFSKRCGLSQKVLRSYAEVGVLAPATVDAESGYRYYERGQLDQAVTVRLLRRAGVSLADIGRFLAAPSADALDGWERSLTSEIARRRQALAEVRHRLGTGPARTSDAPVIKVRSVRDRGELANLFDLLSAQFPDSLDTSDRRFDDLDARFPADQPLMVVAFADADPVGGALAFRHDDRTVTLRIIAVVEAFRDRGLGRRLVERVQTEARLLGAHTVAWAPTTTP